jgi:hypothetical protein
MNWSPLKIMPIFARRTLQKLINQNALLLSQRAIKQQVNALNSGSAEKAIATEWEIVILNALSKIGSILHEQNFGGTSNPDIYFQSESDDFEFLGDIRAVSDEGLHQKNPIRELYLQVSNLFRENGIDRDKLFINAFGNSEQIFKGKERPKLFIPGISRFRQEIFDTKQFQVFLNVIKEQPDQYSSCHFPNFNLEISYDPKRRMAGMSYDSYTHSNALYKEIYDTNKDCVASVTEVQNPIYFGLEAKRDQLLCSGYKGNLGIFLCDGGSHLFQQRGDFNVGFGIDRTIERFLRQKENECINFVISLTVQQNKAYNPYFSQFNNPPRYEILVETFISPKAAHLWDKVEKLNIALKKHIPLPANYLSNAVNRWKDSRNEGNSFKGGGTLSQNLIKVSARELLDVLAGKDKFEDHFTSCFANALRQGRLIENIFIERIENEDDEWITFEFGELDAAISPFKIPTRNE